MYNTKQFSDYYKDCYEEIRNKIIRETDVTIANCDSNELSEYHCQYYILEPINIDEENSPSWDHEKYIETIPSYKRERGYQQEGNLDYECEKINLEVPILYNRNIKIISELQSTSRYISNLENKFYFKENKIVCSMNIKGYGFHITSEDQIAKNLEQEIKRINEIIKWKNQDIIIGNEKLKNDVLKLILEKKQKIEQSNEKMISLTKKISIPLKKKEDAIARKIEISEKPIVKKIKPSSKQHEEYQLDSQKVVDIINFLDNQGKQFEKTPSSYEKLEEDDLRNILLVNLNSIFEGKATGETFSKKGKTDIYLNIDKGSILIFECKIWNGEKLYQKTIEQIRRYLTWRHNFGVMITFVKKKNFSEVLMKAEEAIKSNESYIKGFKVINKTQFISMHALDDEEKEVEIHHLFYNLYE